MQWKNNSYFRYFADVGLRRTCADYRTSARAMCVRKCVRKGFGTVRAKVRAYGQLSMCDLRSHFFTCSLLMQVHMQLISNPFLHMYILSIILDLTLYCARSGGGGGGSATR